MHLQTFKRLGDKKIDYNTIANDYDLTRTANINTINLFAAETALDSKTVLDFGCGTGN